MVVDTLEAALRYAASGLSVVPVLADGSKAAAVEWKPYQRQRAGSEDVRRWLEGKALGVAILCGEISGNLLVIDFDQPRYFDEWAEAVRAIEPDLLGRLPIVKTPTGYGRHVYLRTQKPEKGTKLAREPDPNGRQPWVVAIETRGEGQYVVAPGSPGACHPTGHTYDLVGGPFVEEAPVLDDAEVALLIACARSLNRWVDAKAVIGESARAAERVHRPGDDYCRRGDWAKLLEKHNWELVRERGDESFWRRPGKDDRGISATLGHCRSEVNGPLLYVFSSNAAPFEPDRAYNIFGAFAILEFSGDFHAAAVRLAADGYGHAPPEALLAEVQEVIRKIREKIPVMGESVALLPRKRIDAPLKSDPKFKRTWNRSRPELRLEQTRYDTSLLWYARKLNFTIEEMVSLVYDHRVEHGCPTEQVLDPSYMAKKLAWVFSAGESEEDTLARADSQQVIEGGDDNVLHEIRERTAIKDFVRVIQRGEDEEMYCIELTDGRIVEIGRVNVFREQQKKFIGQLYKRLRVNMEELKNYEWKALHDLLLQRMVVQAYEDEAIMTTGNDVVEQYISGTKLHVVLDEKDRMNAHRNWEPYVEGGVFFLSFNHFWRWVSQVRPDTRGWGAHRMRSILKDLGFKGQRLGGPYPRVYQLRAIDDFPSRLLADKVMKASAKKRGATSNGRESTYD